MTMRRHHPEVLGEWGKFYGFDYVARAYHPQEVEKRRQEGLKYYHTQIRKKQEREHQQQKEKRR